MVPVAACAKKEIIVKKEVGWIQTTIKRMHAQLSKKTLLSGQTMPLHQQPTIFLVTRC